MYRGLTDFTLADARRFYLRIGDALSVNMLKAFAVASVVYYRETRNFNNINNNNNNNNNNYYYYYCYYYHYYYYYYYYAQ